MSILDSIRSEGEGFGNIAPSITQVKDAENNVVSAEYAPADVNSVTEVKAKPIVLTAQQRALVEKAKANIDFMNPLIVQSLDEGINKELNAFNSKMLERAKVSEVAEMSPLIVEVVQKSKSMDPSVFNKPERKGLMGLFSRGLKKFDAYKMQFETVERQFDKIVAMLNQDVIKQKQSLVDMDKLYQINWSQYNDLKLLIVAGEEKLADIHANVLPALKKDAEENPDSFAVQTYNQSVAATHRLEKKVSDMRLLRVDCIQTAQIIHIIESNAIAQIDSTTQTINGTIQQWKRSVTISLTLRDQKAAAERDKLVRDANNELRQRTAEQLKETAVLVAENNERGIIDMSTLESVNKNLIETMQRVSDIQKKGRERRRLEVEKLDQLEQNLRQAVIAHGQNQQDNYLAGRTDSIAYSPTSRLEHR